MKIILFTLFVINGLTLFSQYQQYYYNKQDTSPIILLSTNKYNLIYRHTYNNFIYKMNYNKMLLDSVYINSGFLFGDFKNNDTIILIGTKNDYSKICYAILDSNLNVLKDDSIDFSVGELFIKWFHVYKDRIVVSGDMFEKAFIFTFSLNGNIIDTIIKSGNFAFAHNSSDSSTFFAITEGFPAVELYVYNLDTALNIISKKTISNFHTDNAFYATNYKNMVVISGNYIDFNFFKRNIATGIFDMFLDTCFAFDYFNLGDSYPYIIGLTTNDNKIYVANFLNFFYTGNTLTSKDSICITQYDGNLNIKWQRFIGGDNNYHVMKIFPAPDGGCIFSMTIHDLVTDTYDGVIVWLDSLGNKVLSIPQNIDIFDKFIIYPNPGSSDLNVLISENFKATTFELYNSVGVLCKEEQFDSDRLTLNTNELKSGLYFYRLRQGNNIVSQGKWVKK
ncbi:MAG: hypothetical protein Fur0028_12950 [Bacteroidales bacterium]